MTGGTFGLAWPWVLLALPLPWILQRLLPPARPAGGAALQVPFFQDLKAMGTTHPAAHSRAAYALASLACWWPARHDRNGWANPLTCRFQGVT